jgi:hypothetical protein
MSVELPEIVDFGSIASHTFTNTGQVVPGQGPSGKDHNVCDIDKFGEYSCHVS